MTSFFFGSDESVLLLIQDSVDELLLSLDVRQIDPAFVWPALRTLAQSCQRWRATSDVSSSPSTNSSSSHGLLTELSRAHDDVAGHVTDHVTPESIEEFFIQYHREKQSQAELGDLSEADMNTSEEQDIHEEEDPYNQLKELSPLSHTVVEVMQRCGHHMSAESPQLRLVVMETLSHCLIALRHDQVSFN